MSSPPHCITCVRLRCLVYICHYVRRHLQEITLIAVYTHTLGVIITPVTHTHQTWVMLAAIMWRFWAGLQRSADWVWLDCCLVRRLVQSSTQRTQPQGPAEGPYWAGFSSQSLHYSLGHTITAKPETRVVLITSYNGSCLLFKNQNGSKTGRDLPEFVQ